MSSARKTAGGISQRGTRESRSDDVRNPGNTLSRRRWRINKSPNEIEKKLYLSKAMEEMRSVGTRCETELCRLECCRGACVAASRRKRMLELFDSQHPGLSRSAFPARCAPQECSRDFEGESSLAILRSFATAMSTDVSLADSVLSVTGGGSFSVEGTGQYWQLWATTRTVAVQRGPHHDISH